MPSIEQLPIGEAVVVLEQALSQEDLLEVEWMQDRLEDALAEIYEPAALKAIRRAIEDHTSSAAASNRVMHNAALASLRLALQTFRSLEKTMEDSQATAVEAVY